MFEIASNVLKQVVADEPDKAVKQSAPFWAFIFQAVLSFPIHRENQQKIDPTRVSPLASGFSGTFENASRAELG